MRLIDADDAPLYLNKTGVEQIKKMPTVDAVAVVRCKDCKHWKKDVPYWTGNVRHCLYANWLVGGSGYCVYGERGEEE